ncbi:MAG: DUF5615 family PIN-like protein [Casimicrobiaceae bacterium]
MIPDLLVNENFPTPSLLRLRQAGYDAASVSESAPGSTDVEVLDRAVRENRWLVTFDRDYGELVFARRLPASPAVILLRVVSYRPTDSAGWIQSLCAEPLTGLADGARRLRDNPFSPPPFREKNHAP